MDEKVVVQYTWTEILKFTFTVLNYQLFELDGHGVSLGKLISGIFMLIIGYLLSRHAAKVVDKRVLVRMNVEDHLRYTLRRFIFYFFVCLATLFTLHTLAVPVTIFTVIGGALAVGVGFGSQNLVNNFISGVLVMMERPIRVGDYIEIEGLSCQVLNIGIRSTMVRSAVNAVITIPNTVFIEKNLTNWTTSPMISCAVRIGVAYGTDTRRLSELCLKAVGEIEQVLRSPAPWITFVDFGDSALLFDVGFNIDSASFPSKKVIESSVRFRLNDLFNLNKIEVPFPQRDLHMRSGSINY